MDLAKIRKKSLLIQDDGGENNLTVTAAVPDYTGQLPEAVPTSPKVNEIHALNSAFVAPLNVVPCNIAAECPEKISYVHSPLETLLAGRTAAGCDDEALLADEDSSEVYIDSALEFLCFRVSDEIYGINIMDIKEIIKPREVTEVPRAPAFVSGVLSLRGTIIPVIDMRVRLGLSSEEPTGKERIVVVKNSNSFSGLLVDEVIQVVQIQPDAIEAAPTVLDGIDRDFVSGIGRSENKLMIILNLENIADILLY